jgi:hypothetical protein
MNKIDIYHNTDWGKKIKNGVGDSESSTIYLQVMYQGKTLLNNVSIAM